MDTRQGSIYFDAVAACALKLANFYVDAGCVLDLVFVGTASGKYLDAKGQEYGLTRNPSTPARYHYIYEGTRPLAGARFFTDGLYFTLEEADGASTWPPRRRGGGQRRDRGDARRAGQYHRRPLRVRVRPPV
ncbi:MAG: hypothetical protein ACLSAF_15420 [Intestinimonas sp.]